MATATFPTAPAPTRHGYTPTNGSDRDQTASSPGLAPLPEARKPTSPPVAAATDSAHPTTASPGPIRTSIAPPTSTIPPLDPTHGTTGLIPGSRSRDGTSSSVPVSESDSASWSREESLISSEDDYLPPPPAPGRFPLVSSAALTVRAWGGGAGPPFTWRPTASRHSQAQRTAPAASPESRSENPDEAATSLPAEARGRILLIKLEDQRGRIKHLRTNMAEKREEVRKLRRQKAEADNSFMQLIRPHLAKRMATAPADLMGERFHEMQSIRDDYYSAESAYEALEKKVDGEEDKLQALEMEFFRLLYYQAGVSPPDATSVQYGRQQDEDEGEGKHAATAAAEDPDNDSDDQEENDASEDDDGKDSDPASASRISLLGISGNREDDIHPLYQELLDTVADREDAGEAYDELRMRHDKILYDLEMKLHRDRVRNNQGNFMSEDDLKLLRSSLAQVPTDAKEFRAKFGVGIDDDDIDFLRGFEHEEVQLRRKLEQASDDVEQLRKLCTEKGVMRKNASYNEEFAIFSGSNRTSLLPDGNMSIEPHSRAAGDLAHPKFPILVSNPSHVLDLLSPKAAMDRAMRLPKDNPANARRRAECMKELGITNLMKKVESKPDYINQWLIHRLRTSPMEVELMFTIAEESFKIVNLRRWQEEVLSYWRRDEAAQLSPLDFQGPQTAKDELGIIDDVKSLVNSVIEASTRPKSEAGGDHHLHHRQDHDVRSVLSFS